MNFSTNFSLRESGTAKQEKIFIINNFKIK